MIQKKTAAVSIPNDDNGEIEQIPRIAQVGPAVCDETIGDDFHDAFNGENNQEDIFHFFLSSKILRMIEAKKKKE